MATLQKLLLLGGVVHFGILTASALVPFVLDWKRHFAALPPFLRELFWVYGAFIVLTIIGFGTLTVTQSASLASGTPLARAVCGLIAFFWAARLAVQLFLFDIRPIVSSKLLRLGNHGLTVAFTYLCLAYGVAALVPGWIR